MIQVRKMYLIGTKLGYLLPLTLLWLTLSGFTGFVISVHDGDTLKLKGGQVIRLEAIDAPEIKQAYGVEAREKLQALTLNKEVEVIECGKDRYGRTIGKIRVGNTDVNAEMVRSGHAWWFRKYAAKDTELRDLEAEARSKKLGLWASEAEAPWEFRKNKSHQ